MLRRLLLTASRNDRVEDLVKTAPLSRAVVRRFVAGDDTDDAVRTTRELVDEGLTASLDHLGEDTTEVSQAKAVTEAYITLLSRLDDAGLTGGAEVSVKLSAIGQALDRGMCLDLARQICEAATTTGTTVTLDAEDHTTTAATLETLTELRRDFPGTGAVVQSYLRRTAGDVEDLIRARARVRLCKGAYKEPESVAYQSRKEVDLSYVRLLVRLMRDGAYPMVATHDPRLVAITASLAKKMDRAPETFEYQMLYGVRPAEQRRLAATGARVRVYTPYGAEWYGYLMRRMAERPANLQFFLRALASRS